MKIYIVMQHYKGIPKILLVTTDKHTAWTKYYNCWKDALGVDNDNWSELDQLILEECGDNPEIDFEYDLFEEEVDIRVRDIAQKFSNLDADKSAAFLLSFLSHLTNIGLLKPALGIRMGILMHKDHRWLQNLVMEAISALIVAYAHDGWRPESSEQQWLDFYSDERNSFYAQLWRKLAPVINEHTNEIFEMNTAHRYSDAGKNELDKLWDTTLIW